MAVGFFPRLLSSSCLSSSSAASVGFSCPSPQCRSVDCALTTERVQCHSTKKNDWPQATRNFKSRADYMRECVRRDQLEAGGNGGETGGKYRFSVDECQTQDGEKHSRDVTWSSSRLADVANEMSSVGHDHNERRVEALTLRTPELSRTVRDGFYTGSHREVSLHDGTDGMHKRGSFLDKGCREHLEYSHMVFNLPSGERSPSNAAFSYNAERYTRISEVKVMAGAVAGSFKSQGMKMRENADEAGNVCPSSIATVPRSQLQHKNSGYGEMEEIKTFDLMGFVKDERGFVLDVQDIEDRSELIESQLQSKNIRSNNMKEESTRESIDLTTDPLAKDERGCVPAIQEIEDSSQSIEHLNKVSTDYVTRQMVCSVKDVLIVDNPLTAKDVVNRLRSDYRNLVHACDTEVAEIDVKKQSPVGHGEMICFSIYCGPEANFGDGKSCVWVDMLDNYDEIIAVFKEYFEDQSIKKVWHNFSFDKHALANHGIKAVGFYADTMHLARLWNSGRKGVEGSYSLESLTSDEKVMNGVRNWSTHRVISKISMKDIFGSSNVKKDGTEGKLKVLPPLKKIQTSHSSRDRWICYSAGDAICTWSLWESLHEKLKKVSWVCEGQSCGSMYDFYDTYWQPFGQLLVDMEAEGMLVDREYLAEIERRASKERELSICRFRQWAAKHCPDSKYINVTSDAQIRQLLFGGFKNIDKCRSFKVPNTDGFIEEGKKSPKKFRSINIQGLGVKLHSDLCTSSGLPAVSMPALKSMAGNVSADCYGEEEGSDEVISPYFDEKAVLTSAGVMSGELAKGKVEEDLSLYGTAFRSFNGGQEGKAACRAIAALCEISSIDTLLSNFIKPLQEGDILGRDGRVHCSLNLNTETGRLSARRPNLQNQPALEKDRYKIRQAFIACPGNSLIVADYGQLELRLLAHLTNCKSMLKAFEIGGDFHSRTAMNMYEHVRKAVERGDVLLEWEPKLGENSPPVPLLKDVYGAERRKAKMLNFSIAYGKTAKGLAKDWKVSLEEAQKTVNLWYRDRHEVREWQEKQKISARQMKCVHTLLGRARHFPDVSTASGFMKGHIDRAAINTPVQGSAADVAMLAMLEIAKNKDLKNLGWKLLLQVHDEMILEGPTQNADAAKDLVAKAMSYPFGGKNKLNVELAVDLKYANSWYAAK